MLAGGQLLRLVSVRIMPAEWLGVRTMELTRLGRQEDFISAIFRSD